MSDQIAAWLKDNPDASSLIVALTDLNGTLRGKRVPIAQVQKAAQGGLRLPLSVAVVDVWGRDIEGSELVFEAGDIDGICRPTGRGVIPYTWSDLPTGLLQVSLETEEGAPFLADCRQALAAIVDRFAHKGLRPVVATELEFYLTDVSDGDPQPPHAPGTERRLFEDNVLSVSELEEFSEFLDDVYAACEAQSIPADAAISENGAGQFEINLLHCDDPLRAADDAVLFKNLVRNIARKHGFAATFMAKPYGDRAGNGMHVHFSLIDEAGNNVFDDGGEGGTPLLHQAVAGLLATMQETTLIFAPHANSYRRLRPGSHAPTGVAWGYENRTAAIRIPGGDHKARRIEHRVAGGDSNPYLVLAALLGGALIGIEDEMTPAAPQTGDIYSADVPSLPTNWVSAIDAFEEGQHVTRIFDPLYRKLIVQAKRQELDTFLSHVPAFEYSTYLEVV